MKIKKIISVIVLTCFCSIAFSQTITIDTTITSDCEIYPFSQNDTVYGLKISGEVSLNSDTSLLRVIFIDTSYKEYMIYETYPLISNSYEYYAEEEYDETYCLDELIPYGIRIEIINSLTTA